MLLRPYTEGMSDLGDLVGQFFEVSVSNLSTFLNSSEFSVK